MSTDETRFKAWSRVGKFMCENYRLVARILSTNLAPDDEVAIRYDFQVEVAKTDRLELELDLSRPVGRAQRIEKVGPQDLGLVHGVLFYQSVGFGSA